MRPRRAHGAPQFLPHPIHEMQYTLAVVHATLTSILAILFSSASAIAQDSARAIPKSIDIDVSAAHYYQTDAEDRSAYVSNHPTVRQAALLGPYGAGYVSDNPLYHGGTFAKLGALVTFIDGVTLDAEIVAEHRGISYGVYATDEMIIFPRMLLGLDTTFTAITGDPVRVIARVGNFTDLRWYEGLQYYNMDGQGSDIEIGWSWLRLWRRQIGDAVYGLGLGIGDVAEFGAGLLDVPLSDSLTADLSIGHTIYAGTPYRDDEGFNYSLGLEWGSIGRLYGEIGTRNLSFGALSGNESAFLLGLDGRYALGPVDIAGRAEWREYGRGFNEGRTSHARFRSPGSTIGDFLYPLDYLERPFSQWAVYTEYQSDITAFTLQLDTRVHLPYGFLLRAVLDFNEIQGGDWPVDSYDFFDIGLGWEPVRGLSIIASRTNRAMNLDRSYPTYYMYTTPVQALTVRWNVR